MSLANLLGWDFVGRTPEIIEGIPSLRGIPTHTAGSRQAVSMAGVDVWNGPNDQIDFPDTELGTAIHIVSSSTEDNPAGTGVRVVNIVYNDVNGNLAVLFNFNMNGTTLTDTGIIARFVQLVEAVDVGSNDAAVGDIHMTDATGTPVYAAVMAGTNQTQMAMLMVPLGHTMFLQSWTAGAVLNKSVELTLFDDASFTGQVTRGAFRPRSFVSLKDDSHTEPLLTTQPIPELTILIVRAIADVNGADIFATINGWVLQNSYVEEIALAGQTYSRKN